MGTRHTPGALEPGTDLERALADAGGGSPRPDGVRCVEATLRIG